MAGYLQRDLNDKIISMKKERSSDRDIEITDAQFEDFFSLREELGNYYIKDDTLFCKEFVIDKNSLSDALKTLELQSTYRLDLDALIILRELKAKTLKLFFPKEYIDQYREESFILAIDGHPTEIKVADFLDDNGVIPYLNEYYLLMTPYSETSVFQISEKINYVVFTDKLINLIPTRADDHVPRQVKEGTIVGNKINVLRQDGRIRLPAFLKDKLAFYVNPDNRNEIIEIEKAEDSIPYIAGTVVLIDDYELQPH